ncbi:MAG: gamma-carboxygeranoyl-CoA hydratase [Gammaproteobacteria bacterium]|nr:MAG: gamma-carboxygeranoyl-CoA hydratase [Gammaproteobacteria bacterium]
MNQPDTILTSIDGRGVATVTLNDPEKHNAFDDVLIQALTQSFQDIANNDDVRVMILASNGRSFSAGADLGWMKRMVNYSYDDNLQDARELARMLKTLAEMPQPTIAAVQGATFGGAVGLVSCCDMALASERAVFSLSEVRIGLIPATIGPYVVRAIGERASRRYFMTGERFRANTAYHLGLVADVVAPEDLDSAVQNEVNSILTCGPQAVRAAKNLVNEIGGKAIDDKLIEYTCERIATIRASDEAQEGLGAFLEKRSPAWLQNEDDTNV